MRRLMRSAVLAGIAVATASCGELTGPKSPSTPINVRATLASPTSVLVTWDPSPQNDGVISYNVFRNGTKVGESTTTSYTDTGLAQQTTYKYTVSANCTSGVLSDQSAESPEATVTTLDVTPPRVTAVSPVNGATGVSLAGTAVVTFSEAIDPATLTPSTYNLRVTSSGEVIPGTITYNATAHTAEYKPSASLPNGTNITVTVTAGVKDLGGNALSPVFTSTFTTRDELPPTVIATSPANGATGAAPTDPITITFSEAMDATTITASNITMRATTSGTAIAGTVTYNNATRVATFTPSSALAQNTSYTVTVSGNVKDVAGNAMGSNYVFSFTTGDTTPPTVIATNPTNLATGVSPAATVTATFSEAMDPQTINTTTFTLRVTATSATVTGTVTYNAATNTATFTPSAALAPGTTYTARITTGAKDASGNSLAAQFEWTFITGTTPTVVTVVPANNANNVSTNTSVVVTFSEPMDQTTINTGNITLRTTSSSTAVTGTVTYNPATNSATFTPSSPLANNTNYTFTVSTAVRSAAGIPLASQFTSTFMTQAAPDNTRPTVVSTSPANGATNVSTSAAITITFSEPMDQTTINGTNITVKVTSVAGNISGTVTYNNATNTATFTPSSPLLNNTNYTVTVSTGVKDLAGNSLLNPYTFSFTTAADTIAPTVIATSPTNGAANVPLGTTVTVTFSEDMDQTTINTTTFTLRVTSPSAAVTGTVTYNPATRVATFTPSAALAPSTNYTATVTTGAKDVAGNALTGNFTFSFTTGTTP